MNYLYFPGCSLKSTGRAYDESLTAAFEALDVGLQEIRDWNCCGATAYFSIEESMAFALAARNLALAEAQREGCSVTDGKADLLAPCAACFLVLSKTQKYMHDYDHVRDSVTRALTAAGYSYSGMVNVRHPLDVLVNDVGLDRIAKAVKKPLKGLKVACYYGCQIVRPFSGFDSPWTPDSMDRIVKALGAEPVDWPLKTRCCGGSLTGTIQEAGLRCCRALLREAHKRGADVVLTACPLCQFNLECYQDQINRQFKDDFNMPVAYFTQLMGMAFGVADKKLGLQRLFIPAAFEGKLQKGGTAHA